MQNWLTSLRKLLQNGWICVSITAGAFAGSIAWLFYMRF